MHRVSESEVEKARLLKVARVLKTARLLATTRLLETSDQSWNDQVSVMLSYTDTT